MINRMNASALFRRGMYDSGRIRSTNPININTIVIMTELRLIMSRLLNSIRIGDLCFKGLREDGITEIGYGILEEHRGQGYATEAVQAACQRAFGHAEVKLLEAETDAENAASQRVLEKCGFRPNGTFGKEGPRFTLGRLDIAESQRQNAPPL